MAGGRADEAENYDYVNREWIERRAMVEQAKGIVMERFAVDSEAAFALLRRLSQNSNRKVADIAAELVRTRELPHDPISNHRN